MSVTIEVTLSLPVPVVLPAVCGRMRRMRAESVTVRGKWWSDVADPMLRIEGPCLRRDGTAARTRTSYGVGAVSAVLELGLPDDDRAVIDQALRAWWAATDAAEEVLP